MLYLPNKKRRRSPLQVSGEKRHLYVPLNFYNVNSLEKAKGHYRDKTVLVKNLSKHRSLKYFCLREAPYFGLI